MRALAADTRRALEVPLADWRRPGASACAPATPRPPSGRGRIATLPTALVTTPESLTLMLTRADARERLAGVHTLIVDEWHEMVGNKRGVQVQLALARLRRWNPQLVVWGLSATLGNLDEAMHVAARPARRRHAGARPHRQAAADRHAAAARSPGRFSWAGHLGAQMQQPVVRRDRTQSSTTLVFTNVRSQAEIWYQLLLAARPEWAGQIALHHGSLDKAARDWVEQGLKDGTLEGGGGHLVARPRRGLPAGGAGAADRLGQGRGAHAAARRPLRPPAGPRQPRDAGADQHAGAGRSRGRAPRRGRPGRWKGAFAPDKPLDVLVQHLVSIALGGGFRADELFAEVRTAYSYRELAWRGVRTGRWTSWCAAASSLKAYPEYHRVVADDDGVYRVPDRGIALRHRLQVGTIVSDCVDAGEVARRRHHRADRGRLHRAAAQGRLLRLRRPPARVRAHAGHGRLRAPGHAKERHRAHLERRQDAAVERAGRRHARGARARAARRLLRARAAGGAADAAMRSRVCRSCRRPSTLLVEHYRSREGHHLSSSTRLPAATCTWGWPACWPGGWRACMPNTFSMSVNDYGFELLAAQRARPAAAARAPRVRRRPSCCTTCWRA